MIDWKAAYAGLHAAGYNDGQIARLAGVDRFVINRVRNGRYRHNHEPGYEGGVRVVEAITEAIRQGILDEDPLAQPTPTEHQGEACSHP